MHAGMPLPKLLVRCGIVPDAWGSAVMSAIVGTSLVYGAALGLILATAPLVRAADGASLIAEAGSWGYRLQGASVADVAMSPYDLVVIDYSRDGTASGAYSPDEVAQMKQGPDGRRRLVLAYLSIGEAEDYRFYWQSRWSGDPPGWLGPENPDWAGNYAVRYWDAEWQALIFGSPEAYLDRIIAAGFDGAYLDRVDSFAEALPGAPDAATRIAAMTGLVEDLSRYAKADNPGFLIVPQNGEELLADPGYVAAIDGLGKEDLFFGVDGDGVPNPKSMLRASLGFIEPFRAAGKPVFIVEYLDNPSDIALAARDARVLGAPLFIGERALDRPLSVPQ